MKLNFVQNIIDVIRGKRRLKSKIVSSGKNNQITLADSKNPKLKIFVFGDNNTITIDTVDYFDCTIYIGSEDVPCSNTKISIGEKTTSNGLTIRVMEDNSLVDIGKDVMFSENIMLFCTDTHSILDNDGNVLNLGKSVVIGEHCWIGQDVRILKNTKISNNSVIGLGSVVTKEFDSENVVIAGNPAKVVKENICWDRKRPQEILNNK